MFCWMGYISLQYTIILYLSPSEILQLKAQRYGIPPTTNIVVCGEDLDSSPGLAGCLSGHHIELQRVLVVDPPR